MPLRVGYVREHFASPLLQFADDDQNKTFTLVEHPGGTGSLIAALQNKEIDVAIALTDPLIAGIARGSDAYRLVGSYVSTPLRWAVITGKDSRYQSISELKGTTIGISRPGSGSQTMAAVVALQQKWFPPDSKNIADKLSFKVNNDINGLINSVNDGSTSAFMWEWFTTKPWVDRGEARFIGSVLTPWPSWLIAAHADPERAAPEAVRGFLSSLTRYVTSFDSHEKRATEDVQFIKERFKYTADDINAWLSTVGYPTDCGTLPVNVIIDTLSVLEKAGVVQRPPEGFDIDRFTDSEVVRLID